MPIGHHSIEEHARSHARAVAAHESSRATWANRIGCKLAAEDLTPDFAMEDARKALANCVRAQACIAILDAIEGDVRRFMRRHAK